MQLRELSLVARSPGTERSSKVVELLGNRYHILGFDIYPFQVDRDNCWARLSMLSLRSCLLYPEVLKLRIVSGLLTDSDVYTSEPRS